MAEDEDFFWRKPTHYIDFYDMRLCGYVNYATCIFGGVTNLFTIIVLLKQSSSTSMNTILIHLMISETLATIALIPHGWQQFFRVEKCSIEKHRTLIWEMISFYSLTLTCVLHQVAIWLAIMLSVWRYIAVLHPLKERRWCSAENTRKLIFTAYCSVFVCLIPGYFAYGYGPTVKLVDEHGCPTSNYTIGKNITIYTLQAPIEDYPVILTSMAILFGTVGRIVPSIVLAYINIR